MAARRTIRVFTLLAWLATVLFDAGLEAGEPVKVGVLKLSSSAPIFVGVEKGFFREFGSEPELVYFQAAGAIVTAVAARQIEVGRPGSPRASTMPCWAARRCPSSRTRGASGPAIRSSASSSRRSSTTPGCGPSPT
jgi:ABC-type nitrate/sulfonate/bicarbonate transport system substrate-binding protein